MWGQAHTHVGGLGLCNSPESDKADGAFQKGKLLVTSACRISVVCSGLCAGLAWSETGTAGPNMMDHPVMNELRSFAHNLIGHARDRYGPKHTPLFVCQLNIDTKRLPPPGSKLYSTGGRGGAGPTMNNLEFDFGLIRFLDALSEVTGEPRYSRAVDEYLEFYLRHLPATEPEWNRGLWPWGDHRGYDVVTDEVVGGPHEIKVHWPPWDRLWKVDPAAVRAEIAGLIRHVYDRSKSWGFSRHLPSGHGTAHSMNSSGGLYIAAWTWLHARTGEAEYLERAEGMRDYFRQIRDPRTGLLAAHPAEPAYPRNLQDPTLRLRASRTEYMGPLVWFAPNLLRAASLLSPDAAREFRSQALEYIRAFTSRMDVQADGSFYATFDLATGKPLFPRIRRDQAWGFVPQRDKVFTWSNSVLGLRAPIALAFAYKMTGEDDLRETFGRLLPLFDLDHFTRDGAGRREIPAGLMAQAIVAFLNMYQGAKERSYLDQARALARYARRHYVVDGWVVCGPSPLERYRDRNLDTWRLYSNRGGSPDLALALLRVHAVGNGGSDPAEDNPMAYF